MTERRGIRRREIMVGFVLIAGLAVAAIATIVLKGYDWRGRLTTVDALFEEVGQVMPGSAVKVRGVEIGRVESITVEPSGRAVRLTLQIRRDVTLPRDAVVLLSPESLFGDWQAEIVSRIAFPRYPFYNAQQSDALPGYALPDISRLTAAADEIAQNLTVLTDRVELAFTEETALNLKSAIDNIGVVSTELSQLVGQQARSLERLTSEVQVSAQDLGGAARAARQSFEGVNTLFADGTADTLVSDARVAVRNFTEVSTRLNETVGRLDRAIGSADSTLTRLDRVGARLESGEGTLGRMLNDTTFALRAEDALLQLNALLADLRENPKRYVRLSIF